MLDYSERDEEETVEAVHHEQGPRPARASLTWSLRNVNIARGDQTLFRDELS